MINESYFCNWCFLVYFVTNSQWLIIKPLMFCQKHLAEMKYIETLIHQSYINCYRFQFIRWHQFEKSKRVSMLLIFVSHPLLSADLKIIVSWYDKITKRKQKQEQKASFMFNINFQSNIVSCQILPIIYWNISLSFHTCTARWELTHAFFHSTIYEHF